MAKIKEKCSIRKKKSTTFCIRRRKFSKSMSSDVWGVVKESVGDLYGIFLYVWIVWMYANISRKFGVHTSKTHWYMWTGKKFLAKKHLCVLILALKSQCFPKGFLVLNPDSNPDPNPDSNPAIFWKNFLLKKWPKKSEHFPKS